MTFAAWIKNTREAKRLTKTECARRAGVSHPVWVEYENISKTAQPRRETVEKIALALDVTLTEALAAAGYIQDMDINENLLKRIQAILLEAPEEKRKPIGEALEKVARTMVNTAA